MNAINNKTVYIIILLLCTNSLFSGDFWGPKIKLELKNELGSSQYLYFGVDEKASNGYDSAVKFNFYGKELTEDKSLPPMGAPGGSLNYAIVRDTTIKWTETYSYVDCREIPKDANFMHRFVIQPLGGVNGFDELILTWGKLPAGIDSAKIRGSAWENYVPDVDMKSVESINKSPDYNTSLIYSKTFYITVWYNKTVAINETASGTLNIYPNPTSDYVYLNSSKIYCCKIINMYGDIIQNMKNIVEDRIDVTALNTGYYLLQMFDVNGKIYVNKIMKN